MAGQAAQYDVLVVGCGPVGGMAPNFLGCASCARSWSSASRNRNLRPHAVQIDHEIMRLFQDVGLSAELLPLLRAAQSRIHIGADDGVIHYLGTASLRGKFGWANDYFFLSTGIGNYRSGGRRSAAVVTCLRLATRVARI